MPKKVKEAKVIRKKAKTRKKAKKTKIKREKEKKRLVSFTRHHEF